MDLALYTHVLWRFRVIVGIGVVLGLVLAVLSFYRVDLNGVKPTLTPRKQEVVQADGSVLITQRGFPAGRTEQPLVPKKVGTEVTAVPEYTDPLRLSSYAALYARIANSDDVKKLIIELNGGRQPVGDVRAVPAADTSYGAVNGLPGVTWFGTAPTPEQARKVAKLGMSAFLKYFTEQQAAAAIPDNNRVVLKVLNEPNKTVVVVPRKKTLPIVVFLAVVFSTIALAFILENARPAIRGLVAEDAGDVPLKGVRRSA